MPDIINSINRILSGANTDRRVELLAWEDTPPGAGRPQELINRYVDKADLFLGCLWKTLGSPSGDGDKTGFEEEFYLSIERRASSLLNNPVIRQTLSIRLGRDRQRSGFSLSKFKW